jgi:hypothetical protein
VAAALVVGCGSDRSNLIPPQSASSLRDSLAQVKAAVDGGDCTGADNALNDARARADRLPNTVDRRLRQRINEGLRTLRTTVPRDCAAHQTQTTITTDTTPTTTQTTPTDTTPTTTETTPTDTTPTTTEPTPTTTEPAPPTTDTTPTDTTTNGGTAVPQP